MQNTPYKICIVTKVCQNAEVRANKEALNLIASRLIAIHERRWFRERRDKNFFKNLFGAIDEDAVYQARLAYENESIRNDKPTLIKLASVSDPFEQEKLVYKYLQSLADEEIRLALNECLLDGDIDGYEHNYNNYLEGLLIGTKKPLAMEDIDLKKVRKNDKQG